jgi:hypothetical protein
VRRAVARGAERGAAGLSWLHGGVLLLFGGGENIWKAPVFDDSSERDSMESMAWDDFLSAPALQNDDSIRRRLFLLLASSVTRSPAFTDNGIESSRTGTWSMFCFRRLDEAGKKGGARRWTGGPSRVIRHERRRAAARKRGTRRSGNLVDK